MRETAPASGRCHSPFRSTRPRWCADPYPHRPVVVFLLSVFVSVRAEAQQTPPAPAPGSEENVRCLNCHGQERMAQLSPQQRAGMVSVAPAKPRASSEGLFVPAARFAGSVHGGLRCLDCHPRAATLPHPGDLPDPDCARCHAAEAEGFSVSAHAHPTKTDNGPSPKCWTCHGHHEILPPTERASHTYPLNVVKICTECHQQHGAAPNAAMQGKDLVERYMDSVHGQALVGAGLPIAATCPDCHGAHDVRPSSDPASRVHRDQIPDTCGRCHVGVEEVYLTSVHAQVNAESDGKLEAAVCTSCHTAHRITHAETDAFARDIVLECGTCHEDLYATYRETYHGQVNRLGYRRAARCSDCHGGHDVRRVADAASHLSSENIVATCGKCHEGATASFAEFIPHADFRKPGDSKLLYGIWLYFMIVMSVTFTFFGLHSIFWWVRARVERLRSASPVHGGAAAHGHNPGERTMTRFRPIHRFTHALVITSFMGLTITGLPLKFSDQPWALTIAGALGGGNALGILHRIFACVMCVYVCIHVGVIWRWVRDQMRGGRRGWLFGPDSMMPRWKDLRDLIGMLRWFVGLGPKPQFDRWTYWEKFDYWADAFGTVIIGGSGLLLAFPVVAGAVLPGWIFNVATIVHGYEALLAVGFIFTMHFFNAHLRVEKFPTDSVIFTGRISESEMKEERPLQYERMVREESIESLVASPVSGGFHRFVRIMGIVLLVVGLTIVGLIIWAGVTGVVR